ncbi:complement C1q-like protein 2 [Saccostrea echinata]|uniref:complement C1q-like protein 2 n=1 Tax=Saccostrea echinata TaxID=191078 RepID=UPI002A7EEA76|nr:complement C1q-like protein 2 [Saccostrea echinata]
MTEEKGTGDATLLRTLQDEIKILKLEHSSTLHQLSSTLNQLSSTLSQIADLQHGQNVLREELQKERNFRLRLEAEVNDLKTQSCDCNNSSQNSSDLSHSSIQQVKETITFTLELDMKQQKEFIMSEISSLKAKTGAMAMTISGLVSSVRDVNKQWEQHEKFIFPHVINNVGGGYDADSGVFTVPQNGVYVLSCSLATHSNRMIAKMVKNGNPLLGIASSASDGEVDTGNNLVVIHLQQGDRVWIQHHIGAFLWTMDEAPLSTFSGFILH